jgi:L-asparaginase/Glu-tRNA(Gln) amidotransferase subunit D
MDLCDEAYRQNIPVLMVSPCRRGRIDMGLYPVGKAFLERGVVSAGDMTRECAIIKLMLFLGRRLPFASRHEFMANPLERETSGGVPAGARA